MGLPRANLGKPRAGDVGDEAGKIRPIASPESLILKMMTGP
jgi:hypothetical protein